MSMKKEIILTLSSLFIGTALMAQMKVAGYSFGKPGTDKYEHLEFWTKDGQRTEINYAYGKDRKEVKLQYIGKDQVNGSTCFKVRFTNNYIIQIIPKGLQLQVTDASGNYNKTFSWEYEGPVNGMGTFCNVCAEDDEDAMKLIRSAYLK
jgi:hypothetical protein